MRTRVDRQRNSFFSSIYLGASVGVSFCHVKIFGVAAAVTAKTANRTVGLPLGRRQMPKTAAFAFIRHHRAAMLTPDIAGMLSGFRLLLV